MIAHARGSGHVDIEKASISSHLPVGASTGAGRLSRVPHSCFWQALGGIQGSLHDAVDCLGGPGSRQSQRHQRDRLARVLQGTCPAGWCRSLLAKGGVHFHSMKGNGQTWARGSIVEGRRIGLAGGVASTQNTGGNLSSATGKVPGPEGAAGRGRMPAVGEADWAKQLTLWA
eukprot:789016-Rhodomonas_salina.1